jgi:hypothetical protein
MCERVVHSFTGTTQHKSRASREEPLLQLIGNSGKCAHIAIIIKTRTLLDGKTLLVRERD